MLAFAAPALACSCPVLPSRALVAGHGLLLATTRPRSARRADRILEQADSRHFGADPRCRCCLPVQAFERSNAVLHAALASMSDAVFIRDVHGHAVAFNEGFVIAR